MKIQGFPDNFIDELVAAAVRCNYGQMPNVRNTKLLIFYQKSLNSFFRVFDMFKNIHAFVGSVALAGAQDGLWAIEGGNWKLVEKLLEASKVAFVEAKVRKRVIKTSPKDFNNT